MILDIRTLIVHFILGNLLIAILFAFAFRNRKDRYAALWVGSLIVHALAWLLIVPRDSLPALVTGVVGPALMSLGFAMVTDAVTDFYGVSIRRAWLYLPVPLLAAALVGFGWEHGHIVARTVVSGLILGGQTLFGALVILLQKDRWRGLRYVIGLCAVTMAAMFFARAAISLIDPQALPEIPATSPLQTANFLVASAARITFIFGFLLLIETRRFDELTRLATLDPLTETFNRRTFIDIAERELAHCWRSRQPMALMLMDLDHFKAINDAHGHLAGDKVLLRIRFLAEECLRRQDVFGRYGGEEFCVLAPGTDSEGAHSLAERLRTAIETCGFEIGDPAGSLNVTASIGYAVFRPDESHVSLDKMFAEADQALYRAKHNGRNQVVGPLQDSD